MMQLLNLVGSNIFGNGMTAYKDLSVRLDVVTESSLFQQAML